MHEYNIHLLFFSTAALLVLFIILTQYNNSVFVVLCGTSVPLVHLQYGTKVRFVERYQRLHSLHRPHGIASGISVS